jgi:hypothetical protein
MGSENLFRGYGTSPLKQKKEGAKGTFFIKAFHT